MELISISLASNRGSYEEGSIIKGEFDRLRIYGKNPSDSYMIQTSDPVGIQNFIDQNPNKFLIGFIGYDLGFNMMEPKGPQNSPLISFPPSFIVALDPENIDKDIQVDPVELPELPPIHLRSLVSKADYIESVQKLQQHLQLGDIYEINYCIPFIAENISVDPELIYQRLNQITPMPFSALINTNEFAIISASPERFMKKKNNRLFVQPMKGTKARIAGNEKKDKEILKNDRKERSENVMIVDLTRNDLSKLALKGTVKVEELYGTYAFPSVLQMISTISCEIHPEEKLLDILRATFPMGSMTGAPKRRAMQLIDQYECFARGPFSGMLGYIEPNGDFDFSVLIRTIFYDKVNQKLFIGVGSAITCQSNVEKEYEECLIKLQPLLKALNASIS